MSGPVHAIKQLIPQSLVVRRLPPSSTPAVLLTFDDGPHPEVTPAVLDRLDSYDARALFFVIGRRVPRAPTVLRTIEQRGHRLGNHTYRHRNSYVLPTGPRIRFRDYYRDSRRCQAMIAEAGGGAARYFRPPGGRLTAVTLAVPKLLGMRCVTWSRDVGDWRFRSLSEAVAGARELARQIVPGDIVLLHDDNPFVLPLLDHLLPELRKREIDLSSGIRLIG